MKKTFLLMTAFITLLCIAPGCKGGKKTAQAAAEEPAKRSAPNQSQPLSNATAWR